MTRIIVPFSQPVTMISPFRLNAPPAHQQYGMTVLRITTGIVFCAHGAQKWFSYGLGGMTGAFTQMGVPMPALTAPLVASLELAGGIALIVGVLTRVAALGLAVDMLGAILIVHISNGLLGKGGYELVLMLFSAALAIALGGPGALSVDRMLGRRDGLDAR